MTAPQDRGQSRVPLRRALRIQLRSIWALVVREMMMRYGRDHLGFVWVVLEPMILTAGVLIIWSLIRDRYEHGITIVTLVVTGYLPLTLWRHLTSNLILPFRRSVAMLYHRPISFFDIIFAKGILEFAGCTAAAITVYTFLLIAGYIEPIADLGLIIAGWLLMALFAFAAGTVIALVTELNEITEKFIQPMQYLMLPVSGAFFMLDWFPASVQRLLLWNPHVHCFEMVRAGFMGDSVITHYSPWYTIAWSFALLCLGLGGLHRFRDRMQPA